VTRLERTNKLASHGLTAFETEAPHYTQNKRCAMVLTLAALNPNLK
jgi:hypothetical protein